MDQPRPREQFFIEQQANLPETVKMIQTPEGLFRIIYGMHGKEQSPSDLGSAEALLLESGVVGDDYTTPEGARDIFTILKDSTQYKSIINKAAQEKKSIFLGDVSKVDTVLYMQRGLRLLEPLIGLGLLNRMFFKALRKQKVREKATMTRRELLKKGIQAGVGVWLMEPMYNTLLNASNANKPQIKEGEWERFVDGLTEDIHPEMESVVVTLRNHLLAQKMKTIAERVKEEKHSDRPEVALIVGKKHHGVEEALAEKDDKERAELINRILHIPNLGEVRRRIAAIAEFHYDDKKGEWDVTNIFADPHLESLERDPRDYSQR